MYGPYDRKWNKWQSDPDIVQRFKSGTTGMPIVDAVMRELNQTGFMPFRARLFIPPYLSKDLRQDWRYGAEHLEEMLIDHNIADNYPRFASGAGVGTGRVWDFNIQTQSCKFDPDGTYIRTWVPELAKVPTAYIHDPQNMIKPLQRQYGVQIGGVHKDPSIKYYPLPIPCDKYTSMEATEKIARQMKPFFNAAEESDGSEEGKMNV